VVSKENPSCFIVAPRIQDVLEIQVRCVGSYLGKIKGCCVQLMSSCCVYTKIFSTLLVLFLYITVMHLSF